MAAAASLAIPPVKPKVAPKNAQQRKEEEQRKEELARIAKENLQTPPARLLQRVVRGWRVRRALAQLVLLEEEVIRKPTHDFQAVQCLLAPPESPAGAAASPSAAPASPAAAAPPTPTGDALAAQLPAKLGGLMLPVPLVRGPGPPSQRSSKSASRTPGGASSRAGRSRRMSRVSKASRDPSVPDQPPPEPAIKEEALVQSLTGVGSIEDAARAARAILWLLGTDGLQAGHVHRIAAHHRIRRRNAERRVFLCLALVQHGESYRALPPELSGASTPGGRGAHLGAGRELAPEGWAQVTRTAWALRALPEFAPDLALTASVRCCTQTAARIRELAGGSPGFEAEDSAQAKAKPHPEAIVCPQLDFPDFASPAPTMTVYNLSDALLAAVRRAESGDGEGPPQASSQLPPPSVLLVGGGAALEALLACLNAGLPARRRADAFAYGRLGGGDAVLLRSPALFRVVGATEEEERVRSPSELWEEGLRRKAWQVTAHLTGDGRRPWGPPQKVALAPKGQDSLLCGDVAGSPSECRAEWNRYCGEPLIFSQFEFAQLCERAGSTIQPLSKLAINRVRPFLFIERVPSKRSDTSKTSKISRQATKMSAVSAGTSAERFKT